MGRLVLALCAPVLSLLIGEGLLRVLPGSPPTTFFRPLQISGTSYWVENDAYGFRFFPPKAARAPETLKIPRDKGGELRVVVLGGSAAMGDPLPEFGAPRMLEVLLRSSITNRPVRVINAAMTAINSHVMREIARDLDRVEPDVVVLMLGNNEVLGPFGPSAMGQDDALMPVWRIRAASVLSRFRVYQLIASIRAALGNAATEEWEGLGGFADREYDATDRRVALTHARFESNLQTLVWDLLDDGNAVVLSTLPCNLYDWSPFRSPAAPMQDAAWADGLAHMDEGDWPEAEAIWRSVLQDYPRHAGAAYLLGHTLLKQQQRAEAQRWFQAACDYDRLPFRATSPFQSSIRRVAAMHTESARFAFLDLASYWQQHPDPVRRDAEGFVDHVHFSFSGNEWIANHWADALLGLIPDEAVLKPANAAPRLDLALAASTLAQIDFYQEMLSRFDTALFNSLPGISMRRRLLRDHVEDLRRTPVGSRIMQLDQAIMAHHRDTDDHFIALRVADLHDQYGDRQAARDWVYRAVGLAPHSYEAALRSAYWLMEDGNTVDALTQIRRVESMNPIIRHAVFEQLVLFAVDQADSDASLDLAQRLLREQRLDADAGCIVVEALLQRSLFTEAEALALVARAAHPDDFEVLIYVVKSALATGNLTLARTALEEAREIQAQDDDVLFHDGVLLYEEGSSDEALERFEALLRQNPAHSRAAEQWILMMLDHYPASRLEQVIGSRATDRVLTPGLWLLLIEQLVLREDGNRARRLLALGRSRHAEAPWLQALTAWVLWSTPLSESDLSRARQISNGLEASTLDRAFSDKLSQIER
jgi:tetratricopeptide (TPR) repeat protein